jgi:hypothetical protein
MTTLTDYFISAPLSAIYTIVLGCSMAVVYDATGKWLFNRAEVWMRALYFFAGLLFISWSIFLLSVLKIISASLLQAIAIMFVIAAIVVLLKQRRQLSWQSVWKDFLKQKQTGINRVLKYCVVFIIVCIVLLSITTPTDADSLDYHLGIPLEILKYGSIWYDRHLLHFRLVGFGEMINLFGVANGCIQLGAFMQVIALGWLCTVFINAVPAERRLLLLTMVVGLPLLLFLVPNQKHQLTGVACTALCIYLVTFHKEQLSGKVLALWALTLFFAIGIKYSFVISALPVLLLLFLYNNSYSQTIKQVTVFVLCFIIVLLPMFAFKYYHFGDPLSPLLEHFNENPDPAVMHFQHYLRAYSDSTLPFPVNIFMPASLGNLTTIMGWCAVVVIFFLFRKGYPKETITIVTFLVLTTLFGQKTARFFIEPYMWVLPLIVTGYSDRMKKILFAGSNIQMVLLVPFFLYASFTLVPVILSDRLRHKTMLQYAHGYAESLWLNEILPENVTICTNIRAKTLLPRATFPREYISMLLNKDLTIRNEYAVMMSRYDPEYFVFDSHRVKQVQQYYTVQEVARKTFYRATRNPFNRQPYELVVCKLHSNYY